MRRWIVLLAGGVALWVLGSRGLGSYGAMIAWTLCLQGILALSYDLLGGYGGELHLGHGAFFGIGVYASALATVYGLPWWAALAAAGAAGGIAARLLAPLLVPLRGVGFALSSLGVLLLFALLARNLQGLTGGTAGISLPGALNLGAGPYTGTLLLLVGALWLHDALPGSRFGRALRGTAADPEAAAASGVPTNALRRQALVLGSVVAGLAGGIYPFPMGYVSPQSAFGLENALTPVVMVLVGGPASRWGPLLGVVLYTGVREVLWTSGWDWNLAMTGIGLMAVGLLLPRGMAGLFFRKPRFPET